jgi:di/tricarboxylate transporter
MKIPLFLMAIMVGNGAQAGSLSPLAPTGIIVNNLMQRIGLPGLELRTWLYNLGAHAIVAFGGYFLFGGWKLLARSDRLEESVGAAKPLDFNQKVTLAVIALLITGVIVANVNIGMASFAAAVLLTLMRAADEHEAIRKMPWGTIMMVCGVTVLISLMERTSGMDIFTGLLARVATEATVIPFLAIIIGLISAYSSTSGVVLPAFLPIVPGLITNLGGGVPAAIASTMNVAGHLVDVSPLSTIGALCVASVPAGKESRKLFNQLMAWGLSMTVVGAVLCWILFA